jgi:hypothetical protein
LTYLDAASDFSRDLQEQQLIFKNLLTLHCDISARCRFLQYEEHTPELHQDLSLNSYYIYYSNGQYDTPQHINNYHHFIVCGCTIHTTGILHCKVKNNIKKFWLIVKIVKLLTLPAPISFGNVFIPGVVTVSLTFSHNNKQIHTTKRMQYKTFTLFLCALVIIIGVTLAQDPCKVTIGRYVYDLSPLKREGGYAVPVLVPDASIYFNICGYVAPAPLNCPSTGPTQVYYVDGSNDQCIAASKPSAEVTVKHVLEGNPLALELTIPKNVAPTGYKTTIQIQCSYLQDLDPTAFAVFKPMTTEIAELTIFMSNKHACHKCVEGWTGDLCEEKVKTTNKNALIVIGLIIVIVLVVLGAVGGGFGYYFYKKNNKSVSRQQYQMNEEYEQDL